jgi:hypothetical protein
MEKIFLEILKLAWLCQILPDFNFIYFGINCMQNYFFLKIFLPLTGSVALGFYFLPESILLNMPRLCLVKLITGFECFGCGMTRAFWYILHGEFFRALELNLFSIVVFIVCFIIFIRSFYVFYSKRLEIISSNKV